MADIVNGDITPTHVVTISCPGDWPKRRDIAWLHKSLTLLVHHDGPKYGTGRLLSIDLKALDDLSWKRRPRQILERISSLVMLAGDSPALQAAVKHTCDTAVRLGDPSTFALVFDASRITPREICDLMRHHVEPIWVVTVDGKLPEEIRNERQEDAPVPDTARLEPFDFRKEGLHHACNRMTSQLRDAISEVLTFGPGGPLAPIVKEFGLDDAAIELCLPHMANGATGAQIAAQSKCLDLFQQASLEERAAALALAHGLAERDIRN